MKRSGPHKTYKGVIKPDSLENPHKYQGDIENIIYRSMWERNVMYWLDSNPNVAEWASEELFFPYEHPITGKRAKYFPDFYVKMADGVIRILEIKPKKQTMKPEEPKRKTKNYINEVEAYVTNQEKWKAARFYCGRSNMQFEVWTEDTLTGMGIMKSPKLKPLNEKKKVIRPRPKPPNRTRPKRKS